MIYNAHSPTLPYFTLGGERKKAEFKSQKKVDRARGRTWNLLITDVVVVKRLAIGPHGQVLFKERRYLNIYDHNSLTLSPPALVRLV